MTYLCSCWIIHLLQEVRPGEITWYNSTSFIWQWRLNFWNEILFQLFYSVLFFLSAYTILVISMHSLQTCVLGSLLPYLSNRLLYTVLHSLIALHPSPLPCTLYTVLYLLTLSCSPSTLLYSLTLSCMALHCPAFPYIALHPLHYPVLSYTVLHSLTLSCTPLHCPVPFTLVCISLHCPVSPYTILYSLHCLVLLHTVLNSLIPPCTHYTVLHPFTLLHFLVTSTQSPFLFPCHIRYCVPLSSIVLLFNSLLPSALRLYAPLTFILKYTHACIHCKLRPTYENELCFLSICIWSNTLNITVPKSTYFMRFSYSNLFLELNKFSLCVCKWNVHY